MKIAHRAAWCALAALCIAPPSRGQVESAPEPAPSSIVYKNRAPVAQETLRVRFPRPREYRLPNGLQLMVLEDHKLPTVAFRLSLPAGSFYEPEHRQGLAAMTASMLDEGTKTRSASEIASAVDRLGASLAAGAEQGGERASVLASGLSTDTGAILDLLSDIVLNPTFPDDQLAKVKERTLAALTQALRDPDALAEVAMARALYGDAPPSRVFPPLEQVRSLTRDDIVAFHARHYQPEHALLGVVGDVDADEVYRKVREVLGGWRRGNAETVTLPAFRPASSPRVFLVERPGSVQTALRLGNLAINRKSKDYPALTVANRILGGSAISSRLGKNIREEKGYTYDVYSTFDAPRFPGPWYAATTVRNEVTGPTLAEFEREFRRMREQLVSAGELDAARRGIVGRFALRMESPATLLAMAMERKEYDLPADYWNVFPARIETVTDADVRRVSERYLGGKGQQVIAVGERAQIEDALKPYGPLTVLNLVDDLSDMG